ncbi:hypothetical protein RFI_21264 [Reticulomyxa filosa]|uniref:pyridoxal 5'-phosphate synthase n=1 Tax=Reticulomyxa filosa TaxID=46433 RepID=X6MQG1_RETFI|nr:hypothetical protein RFI_21264 [Reticulomyxa filosa]|eukprot:ETO16094.1 hypothetical protein RFI_21264 [Reticulomyxa filosa]
MYVCVYVHFAHVFGTKGIIIEYVDAPFMNYVQVSGEAMMNKRERFLLTYCLSTGNDLELLERVLLFEKNLDYLIQNDRLLLQFGLNHKHFKEILLSSSRVMNKLPQPLNLFDISLDVSKITTPMYFQMGNEKSIFFAGKNTVMCFEKEKRKIKSRRLKKEVLPRKPDPTPSPSPSFDFNLFDLFDWNQIDRMKSNKHEESTHYFAQFTVLLLIFRAYFKKYSCLLVHMEHVARQSSLNRGDYEEQKVRHIQTPTKTIDSSTSSLQMELLQSIEGMEKIATEKKSAVSTSEVMSWFQQWLSTAAKHPWILEANAMSLSTISSDSIGDGLLYPDSRLVLLKGQDSNQGIFTFFTNYGSNKAKQLTKFPQCSLSFYWEPLYAAVRIQGTIERTSAKVSDDYWYSRPYQSQLSSAASAQSHKMESRDVLKHKMNQIHTQCQHTQKVPRPKSCSPKIFTNFLKVNIGKLFVFNPDYVCITLLACFHFILFFLKKKRSILFDYYCLTSSDFIRIHFFPLEFSNYASKKVYIFVQANFLGF